MAKEIRFGAYVRELTVHQTLVSYNALAPVVERDARGAAVPKRSTRLRVRPIDAYRLIEPYVRVRLLEQIRAVVPLAIYLVLFQILILDQSLEDAGLIMAGLGGVIIGLMLFLEGLKVGLMPLGETLGTRLPSKASLPVVLVITFLLGIGVTFAEPAIGALKTAGSLVDPARAPYLYALLTHYSGWLVLVVGVAVGFAAVLGTLRFLYGWSLKPLIYFSLAPTAILTAYLASDVELAKTLGLAWDCGGVTTGPVTVPLVLALGIGIASAAGKGDSSLSGFGIVTLASIFPVLGVMGLALFVAASTSPEAIIAAAAVAGDAPATAWYEQSPGLDIVMGVRAIVPLVAFLLLVMLVVLRERLRHAGTLGYGLVLALVGMVIFNLGLTYGLARLGGQSGASVPAAFTALPRVDGSPLFVPGLGIAIALLFAFVLGFGATLAEPALNALGATVENLTNGALRKRSLMVAVAVGVAAGLAGGVAKVIFDLPLVWMLVPSYVVAVVLTAVASEELVNVAWDSAGVTTGPVTVPLVLALGLGFSGVMHSIEGFGILAMASVGPIIAVLATGLWLERRVRRRDGARDANGLGGEIS